jgi:hypothetical protein
MIDPPPNEPDHVPGGALTVATTDSVVRELRLPGRLPVEAHAVALERLMEAMVLTSTINRSAADAYMLMFKVALVAAPYGQHGPAVTRILAALAKRLETHLATLSNAPGPSVA